jgi:hypothetical protein
MSQSQLSEETPIEGFLGFDEWLSSFKPEINLNANELLSERKPSELPSDNLKMTIMEPIGGATRDILLEGVVAEPLPLRTRGLEMNEFDRGIDGALPSNVNYYKTHHLVGQMDSDILTIALTGVKKRSTNETIRVTLKVPCHITFEELNRLLVQHG